MVTRTITYPTEVKASTDGITLDVTDSMVDVQVYVDYTGRVGIPTIQLRRAADGENTEEPDWKAKGEIIQE
jgi:hypothetical protein